jgi:hypothetical protein
VNGKKSQHSFHPAESRRCCCGGFQERQDQECG